MALAKSQRSLKAWGKQDWRTKSGKPSSKTCEKHCRSISCNLFRAAQDAATTAAKRKGKAAGKQFVKQPKSIASKVKKYRSYA